MRQRALVLFAAVVTAFLAFAAVPAATAGKGNGNDEEKTPLGQAGDPDRGAVHDAERDCLEAVPAAAGVDHLPLAEERVALDVLVLLDGVPADRGQQVFAHVAQATYDPLGVDVRATFSSVALVPGGDTDAEAMIAAAKQAVGGVRPPGVDVVYALTARDLTLDGDEGVVGLADCIGGVRFPERAFAVGEAWATTDADDGRTENQHLGPVTLLAYVTAKVAAHEIGHLMGAHHHYANCVEGVPTELFPEVEPSPCTLMFNFVDLQSLNFSTASGAVVRGHATRYAVP